MKVAGRIAEQVLSNPLIEEYDVAVQEPVAV
jgi:phosphoribosylformylglycinamidine (FGAM) synthase PurS component